MKLLLEVYVLLLTILVISGCFYAFYYLVLTSFEVKEGLLRLLGGF